MEKIPPELLIEIFNHLCGSAQSLRVNRQWFQHLMPIIWKAVDDRHLSNVTRGRRQMYASAIKSLRLTYRGPRIHEKLGRLEFPRLNTLISDQGLLDRLANQCRQLSRIELSRLAPGVTTEPILHLLDKCSSLERISLHGDVLSDQVIRRLAQLRKLRKLKVGHYIEHDTIDAANLESIPQPFPSIEKLTIEGSELSLLSLGKIATLVRKTKKLDASLGYDPNPALNQHPLVPLTELRELKIRAQMTDSLSPHDFVTLTALPQLEVLIIWAEPFHRSTPSWDDHIRYLASGLPNLKVFSLICGAIGTTAKSLIALGECCQSLEKCKIPAMEFNILDLQLLQAPLFPKLKELTTGTFVPERGLNEVPEKHAMIFASQFPELSCIGYYDVKSDPDRCDFTASVHEAWSNNRTAEGKPPLREMNYLLDMSFDERAYLQW
ncbi:uncharacterized protein DSM5745_09570 [Aspergillus mulundensis]|uniref:F-box domain-containing protein n=1 Tax=Aspergillus mulundensis TaxID=1810919 RepID=A0A3D8QVW6_9EURO|nr:hypothetical protein DSM5745_09570 [Aspergillus mulundensis]RDW65831.1 hypothetical protein DSM5745_09570 [Aspergillus mulundensis]